jgi:peptidoglycan hydrolase-like protein with peptidoglycan-binding domain
MFLVSRVSSMVLAAALVASPAFATTTHRAPTAGHTHASLAHRAKRTSSSRTHRTPKPVGQRGIAPERATEIQSALIRENYISGPPTGQWDAQTEAAMQKFQADHGWQTKLTPDSRALIKLGLGPNSPTSSTPLPADTLRTPSNENSSPAAEAGTLASVHSITQ